MKENNGGIKPDDVAATSDDSALERRDFLKYAAVTACSLLVSTGAVVGVEAAYSGQSTPVGEDRKHTKRYAVIPDRLWDGLADHAVTGMAVVIAGENIERIVPVKDLETGIRIVAASGCTVIPGLIDMHVHYSRVMGRAYLAAGVTTVRDVGNDLDWILKQREESRREPSIGPSLYCAGYLVDGPQVFWPIIGRATENEQAARALVRNECARGVDAIKFYVNMPATHLKAAVEEAHAHGKWALSHLGISAEAAAEAGLDEIEHLSSCGAAWKESTVAEQDALIDVLLAHHVVLTPTLVVWDRIGRELDPVFTFDSRLKWVHPTYRDIWKNNMRWPLETHRTCQEGMPHLKTFLQRGQQRGVPVPTGTDAPFLYLVPGFSLHDELSMYVDVGIAPVAALRCATSVAAGILGKETVIGRIAPGYIADLAIVRGNPLDRIGDITNVEHTIHRGVLLHPEELYRKQAKSYTVQADEPLVRQWETLGH